MAPSESAESSLLGRESAGADNRVAQLWQHAALSLTGSQEQPTVCFQASLRDAFQLKSDEHLHLEACNPLGASWAHDV